MPLFALLLFAVLAVAFVALNWPAIVTVSDLSFGFFHFQAPLGLILLGVAVIEAALFLVYIVWLQGGVLLEARRNSRALADARALAEQAEASRFSELKHQLSASLAEQADAQQQGFARLAEKIDESANGLAASVGELEDRLFRGAPGDTARGG
ncbi:LapA family protein [Crenobacter caeni]|uniref:LapA family protein n=1 Tax=Crenobacter caeni TaxID=2705474 RepID=A0A6B2KSE9_9NEIS|nr:LapA family protein [Crenobacter caeni]NDV12857.1 LapA family protein [Crenobacter caeni]